MTPTKAFLLNCHIWIPTSFHNKHIRVVGRNHFPLPLPLWRHSSHRCQRPQRWRRDSHLLRNRWTRIARDYARSRYRSRDWWDSSFRIQTRGYISYEVLILLGRAKKKVVEWVLYRKEKYKFKYYDTKKEKALNLLTMLYLQCF